MVLYVLSDVWKLCVAELLLIGVCQAAGAASCRGDHVSEFVIQTNPCKPYLFGIGTAPHPLSELYGA
jgi:hypothetical protein